MCKAALFEKPKTNLNLSVTEMVFNFAEKINNIELVNAVLGASYDQFILGIDLFNLRVDIPTIGLYSDCIKHQKRKGFSNVAEYLYYSLMYKSITPIPRYKYLDNPIAYDAILLDVRDLKAKYKSIASFVDRLHSIFALPKFCTALRLDIISRSITSTVINPGDDKHVTMRFNYLNRIVTKLYTVNKLCTEPNTVIKILTYLILLR